MKDRVKRATAVVENIAEKKKTQESGSCEEKIQITADDLTNPGKFIVRYRLFLLHLQGL